MFGDFPPDDTVKTRDELRTLARSYFPDFYFYIEEPSYFSVFGRDSQILVEGNTRTGKTVRHLGRIFQNKLVYSLPLSVQLMSKTLNQIARRFTSYVSATTVGRATVIEVNMVVEVA